jgi:CheY-like chemotaxis protein
MFTVSAMPGDEVAMHHPRTGHTLERRPRALLLDGDGAWLDELVGALAERRVTAVTAPDGRSGLERLLEEFLDFDVLVMDLDLPHRDARSLSRLIRHAGNERDLAIVVLAIAPSPALLAELRALGVDAVVDRRAGPAAAAAAAVHAASTRSAFELELEEPQARA